MESLNFDLGIKTYALNDSGCEVEFNPADWTFVEKVTSLFETLINKQERVQSALNAIQDMRSFYRTMNELDKEMRADIDAVFDKPICDEVFGSINLYAIAGGSPVWANFVFAIWDVLDENLTRESKIKNPKIAKYIDRYAVNKAKG